MVCQHFSHIAVYVCATALTDVPVCTHQIGICQYHLCHFGDALRSLHSVLQNAQKDGDMYFEAQSLYWKSVVMLVSQGMALG